MTAKTVTIGEWMQAFPAADGAVCPARSMRRNLFRTNGKTSASPTLIFMNLSTGRTSGSYYVSPPWVDGYLYEQD